MCMADFCTSCGATVDPADKFCGACGAPAHRSEPSAAPDPDPASDGPEDTAPSPDSSSFNLLSAPVLLVVGAIVAVVAIFMANRGDDSDLVDAADSATESTETALSGFSESTRSLYLLGCREEEPTPGFCECTLDALEDRLSEAELLDMYESDAEVPAEFVEVATLCLPDETTSSGQPTEGQGLDTGPFAGVPLAEMGQLPPGPPYAAFAIAGDENSVLEVEVPIEWSDTDSSILQNESGGLVGHAVMASTDSSRFGDFAAPGVWFRSYIGLFAQTPEEWLDARSTLTVDCIDEGRFPYDDGLYRGWFDVFTSCGAERFMHVQIAAAEEAGDGSLLTVQVSLFTEGDLEALDRIARTFRVPVGDPGAEALDPSPATSYDSYEVITDDDNRLQMQVPTAWTFRASEKKTSVWAGIEAPTTALYAGSGSYEEWNEDYGISGAYFKATELAATTPEEVLDWHTISGACSLDRREVYDDGFYAGLVDVWVDCGDVRSTTYDIVAVAINDPSVLVWVQVGVATDADAEALQRVIDSFQVIGPLTG
jgi:hypothetical protein